MKKVWKIQVYPGRSFYAFPKDAELLYAREQGSEICVWFLTDGRAETENKDIIVAATGVTIDRTLPTRHLGSAHLKDGALVFHVFDATRC